MASKPPSDTRRDEVEAGSPFRYEEDIGDRPLSAEVRVRRQKDDLVIEETRHERTPVDPAPPPVLVPAASGPRLEATRVTTRVILLLLFGTLPLMVIGNHWTGFTIFLAYNAFIFLLVKVDALLSPAPEDLLIERTCATRLSIGQENEISLRFTNQARRPINLVLRDEFPTEFAASVTELTLDLEPRAEQTATYLVTPPRRGRYAFGDVVIRYRGLFELVDRIYAFPAPQVVEVYPNIRAISRFDLRFKRQHLTEMGLINERRRGSGTEFESLREYAIGDEPRRIDWKASARKSKLISRQYQSEINQSIIVALDCSRPMGAIVDGFSLLDAAVNATLLLGHLVTKKEDKFGLLVFNDDVRRYEAPKRGKRHFHQVLHQLFDLQAERVEPDYDRAMKFIMGTRLRRSLVVFLTDLAAGDAPQKVVRSIWLLCRKHIPVVVSITDPAVWEAANATPATPTQAYEQVAALEILERVKQAKRVIQSLGGIVLLLRPHEVNSALLTTYLSVKLRETL